MPVYNHMTEPNKASKKVVETPGIDDLRIHDLSCTAGSVTNISDINTPNMMQAWIPKSMSVAAVNQRVNAHPAKRAIDQQCAGVQRAPETESALLMASRALRHRLLSTIFSSALSSASRLSWPCC